MIKYLKILFLLACILCMNLLPAQEHHHQDHEDHKMHRHQPNEFGLAAFPVYFMNKKEVAFGLHFHYLRLVGDSPFGWGLGYERIFDEHGHNTFGIVGSYRPIKHLSFNLSPGITFEDEDASEIKFAFHIESMYDFEIGNVHIGPLIELAFDPEDTHISLGLHVGYGF
ncbi:MAG: hypothetical protein U5Q03_02150 [Bacteroidota bacterium]|nr:hypothetical protein [Bacteroidota bacterium]